MAGWIGWVHSKDYFVLGGVHIEDGSARGTVVSQDRYLSSYRRKIIRTEGRREACKLPTYILCMRKCIPPGILWNVSEIWNTSNNEIIPSIRPIPRQAVIIWLGWVPLHSVQLTFWSWCILIKTRNNGTLVRRKSFSFICQHFSSAWVTFYWPLNLIKFAGNHRFGLSLPVNLCKKKDFYYKIDAYIYQR